MLSLNISQWYNLFFVEMEANSTLLLTKKKKMAQALIANREKNLPIF